MIQLLNFSEKVGARINDLPTTDVQELLRISWRSLIIGAVSSSHKFFSPAFSSKRNAARPFVLLFSAPGTTVTGRKGLYANFSRPSSSHAKANMANCRYKTVEVCR